jgi:NAD(P)H-hydrate epimerase
VADGTPYLATPGSGDVLAGIIAACAARSASLFDAATVGVWVHAKAGRKAAERSGGAFLASAITDEVGSCLTLLE